MTSDVSRDAHDLSPLAGRSALVTGAASGIGLAIARRLASDGAHVVLVDLPGDALQQAAGQIEGAIPVAADLARREDVARLVADIAGVEILVNNAGLQHVSPIDELSEEAWDRLLSVMLTAPFLLTKGFLPAMYDLGWGRVINIASVHGLVASPFKSAYVAAKHGLVGLTKVTALEAAARCPDVTAHAICPSYVRTPAPREADRGSGRGARDRACRGRKRRPPGSECRQALHRPG